MKMIKSLNTRRLKIDQENYLLHISCHISIGICIINSLRFCLQMNDKWIIDEYWLINMQSISQWNWLVNCFKSSHNHCQSTKILEKWIKNQLINDYTKDYSGIKSKIIQVSKVRHTRRIKDQSIKKLIDK